MNTYNMIEKTGKRAEGFSIMLNHLFQFTDPLIVETGMCRIKDNFEGDGQSTRIFDSFVSENGGKLIAVDNDRNAIEMCKLLVNEKHTGLYWQDSVSFLSYLNNFYGGDVKKIKLLYLDSYDVDFYDPHESALHHLCELTAIMPSLESNSIVAVDDNMIINDKKTGKGIYIEKFMEKAGHRMVYDGYQKIWIIT